jgi:8-oxo-dGTP diphosphatase
MATQIAPADPPVIRAAGGIVQRSAAHGDEVMLVFRKHSQEWSLPKGQVKEDESFQEAALREVELETGCSCRLGSYLGTISYSDKGIPKVVMFWKMTIMEEKPLPDSDEIGDVAWLQVPAAIQRLSQPQERAILSRLASTPPRPQQAAPVPVSAIAAPAPPPEPPQKQKQSRIDDGRVHARLLRESEAFRVELAFLERRSGQADKTWASAAAEQLNNVTRCLESNDIEGGLYCLHAAHRFAVYGLTKAELITRGYILREEAQKISTWRGNAIEGLLSVPDDELTADRLAEAMAQRDEETTNQYYKTRLTGDHLRILLIICSLAVVALLPFMLLAGPARTLAPVLLFGLLGSSFAAAHSLMRGKNESRIPNVFVMLTPVLFGGVAGLAGFGTFEYVAWLLNISGSHTAGILALSFLFGMLTQRVLARLATSKRRKKARA